eukprot:c43462_g1_i1 orf=133-687(+)
MRKTSSFSSPDINFYHQDSAYGCFSNFYRANIVIDGKTWPTTEHYFQAMKFAGEDEALAERIRALDKPGQAAAMGRNRNLPLRKDWDQDYVGADGKLTRFKLEVMRTALHAKFDQHADLRETLLATRGRRLVEKTSKDRYWGDGGDGSGKNMLGRLLVELRDVLIREEEEMKKREEAVSHQASF